MPALGRLLSAAVIADSSRRDIEVGFASDASRAWSRTHTVCQERYSARPASQPQWPGGVAEKR